MHRLLLLGLNHTTAPLEVRERLAYNADQSRAAVEAFRQRYPRYEAVLLSTCNRVELYVGREAHGQPGVRELSEFPKRWPAMQRWTLGRNISQRDSTFPYAFVVEFESEKELRDYLNSEAHEAYVRERWRPVIEQRAIVSYEF